MNYSLHRSLEILQRTPGVLSDLLTDISEDWVRYNEGPNTWNAIEVLGHLIYCDKENWMLRLQHILQYQDSMPLPAYDRFAEEQFNKGKTIDELIIEFAEVRKASLQLITDLHLPEDHQNIKGYHPQLGTVHLSQLISAWVVHDLSHLAQVSRIMAKQYGDAVGPWTEYLRILK
jgi:uncharacterized damage-inducible protein DinB